jgi:hypothetical protein
MRVRSRLGSVALVLVAALGVTCKKDSLAPIQIVPQTLTAIAGNNQSAFTGDSLSDSLLVRVLGSDGKPFDSVAVTWTVTAGTATVSSPSVITDSLGYASTTVTLGGTAGVVGIQASVVGLQPANFIAVACGHPAITVGDSVSAVLASTDCRLSVWYTDFYEFAVPAGPQGLTLTMRSTAFDTYLEVYSDTGALLSGADDIDSTNHNSQLTTILGTGDYLIAPSSFDPGVTGAYTLSAVAHAAELAGCELVWVTRGLTISDSVTANDCVDTTGGTSYADQVALFLEAGSILTVSLQSTAFDAELSLLNGSRVQLSSNNDSAGGPGTNAYLQYTVPAGQRGAYVLVLGTHALGATGAYTLSISASTTLSGSPTSTRGPTVLRMTPQRMGKGLPRRGRRR